MASKHLQVVEVYDSFRPQLLLDVNFRLADVSEPKRITTFRSSYSSIRDIYDGAFTYYTQTSFAWMKESREV